jgi:catechol 2,3-dioxygenase-like lactoylglutathione lyase family enzyme
VAVRLDMVGIAVKDMARSLRFYRLLGLAIPETQDGEPHVEFAVGSVRLAWDTLEVLRMVYGEWDEAPSGHRVELAFACREPAEVDRVYDRMVEHGYHGHKPPWDAFWGQRYAIVEDPDGNLISLFA